MWTDLEAQLQALIDGIVLSNSFRKVVVAGPGTGKTTLFRKLLESRTSSCDEHLVLTFINNLKAELDEALGELACVWTFHGYCCHLLHRQARVRAGLSESFRSYPALPSLIKSHWEMGLSQPVPKFANLMRQLELGSVHK